ncbi:MAG TPA: hypothetical protein VGC77_12310 [Rhodopseudomonas sp.]|uniref:hypothetical protein n=1 Tax=Rhodopseudomonas sp. TaxID=1078 RepID=UPI002EDA31E4
MTFLEELGTLSPGTLAAFSSLATCAGAIATAVIGKLVVTPFLGARDKQDREAEWRKHAIELTKLDLERRLKTRDPNDKSRLRPGILDFLANYRDLQELGSRSPKELYAIITTQRIKAYAPPAEKTGFPKRFVKGVIRLFDHRYAER